MKPPQFHFPFFAPANGPPEINPVVERRVAACRPTLGNLSIQSAEVAGILSEPERHWQRVVAQKDGKARLCYAPSETLGKIQRRIVRHLRARYGAFYRARFPATAYERGCSIVTNARYHRTNRSSWCLDLKGAFGQIRTKHIQRCLVRKGIAKDVAWVFSRLLTYRGWLRQGAPSSPFTFNLLLGRVDVDLLDALNTKHSLAFLLGGGEGHPLRPYDLVYTRYADNLCFSAATETFPEEAKAKVLALIHHHGFRLNPRKVREGHNGVMEFPGVVIVRGRIRPNGAYVAKLSKLITSGSFRNHHVLIHDVRPLLGHRAFLRQFGRRGVPRFIRKNLPRVTL